MPPPMIVLERCTAIRPDGSPVVDQLHRRRRAGRWRYELVAALERDGRCAGRWLFDRRADALAGWAALELADRLDVAPTTAPRALC